MIPDGRPTGSRPGAPHSADSDRMTEIDILFSGVAVADSDTAVPWYARLFARPADLIVEDDDDVEHRGPRMAVCDR